MSTEWYAVTYRAPAEMVVWVLADTPDEARMRAENVEYEDATDVEFVKGRPYTLKVRRDPDYVPSEEYA